MVDELDDNVSTSSVVLDNESVSVGFSKDGISPPENHEIVHGSKHDLDLFLENESIDPRLEDEMNDGLLKSSELIVQDAFCTRTDSPSASTCRTAVCSYFAHRP